MKLETFFEKFDLFADAPDAVAKMRELVFQLAVQGRLVQQERTEEPATVLLKRIRAARAALPANRRSGDETDTIELDDESTPFAAPPGWVWTSLGNVQVFTNGYAFKSEDYQPSGVGIIRMGELGANGEIDERNMKYVSNSIAQSLPDTFRVKPGDLLMGMSGSIGKLAINRSDKTYLLNQRVGRLEPILIEKAFLQVFLRTVEQHYLRISFGMAIKNLSTKQINETPFPLPPLAEQKRIVAKVDELMALCDRLEAQQQERDTRHAALARASLARFADAPTPANLEFLFHPSYAIPPADLRKSILTLAVQGKLVPQDPNDELPQVPNGGQPVEDSEWVSRLQLPDTWIWARFDSLLAVLKNGFSGKPSKVVGQFKVTRIETIARETVDLARVGYADDLPGDVVAKHAVLKGDILFSHINSEPHLGKTAICTIDDPTLVHGVNLLLLRPIAGIDSRYLNVALRELRSAGYFVSIAQRAVNQASINQKNLGKTPIPIPPLAEQLRIVAKVEQLMALVDALETQLAASRATAANLLSALVAELTASA